MLTVAHHAVGLRKSKMFCLKTPRWVLLYTKIISSMADGELRAFVLLAPSTTTLLTESHESSLQLRLTHIKALCHRFSEDHDDKMVMRKTKTRVIYSFKLTMLHVSSLQHVLLLVPISFRSCNVSCMLSTWYSALDVPYYYSAQVKHLFSTSSTGLLQGFNKENNNKPSQCAWREKRGQVWKRSRMMNKKRIIASCTWVLWEGKASFKMELLILLSIVLDLVTLHHPYMLNKENDNAYVYVSMWTNIPSLLPPPQFSQQIA